ncbi:MAG: winged helix DNA-binding domain-containing protein [Arenicella sp.]|nr:winged helix DNA-binding domain-containing protein [Arenicella sp.]
MQIDLSPDQARKLALLSQGIHRHNDLGLGKPATLRAVEKIGYVQIDTISVVERAHHHTLWNRVKNYQPSHLDQLQKQNKVFEYWSHAAAYLPMRDYRFTLPRKQALCSGEKHWYDKDAALCKLILDRIRLEGPLQSRDFEHKRKGKSEWWDWKPAKQMLEQLFMEGKLMIARRDGFQKVYDLTERVLPDTVDASMPSDEEYYDHIIFCFLRANGIGTPGEMAYLRKGIKPSLQRRCEQLLEDKKLLCINVKQQTYYAHTDIEAMLKTPLSRSEVKILSPFDNLLIQRNRTSTLFDFDYQIECYVPAAKRQYGYFCLPLLWGQKFAGRMDAKIDRATGTLKIFSLHLQTANEEDFLQALQPSLEDYLQFNQGQKIEFV